MTFRHINAFYGQRFLSVMLTIETRCSLSDDWCWFVFIGVGNECNSLTYYFMSAWRPLLVIAVAENWMIKNKFVYWHLLPAECFGCVCCEFYSSIKYFAHLRQKNTHDHYYFINSLFVNLKCLSLLYSDFGIAWIVRYFNNTLNYFPGYNVFLQTNLAFWCRI